MIDWSAFTWEAFATLATGFLAVGAAIYVGRRQTGIAERQTRIQAEQVALADLTLRAGLFDRRLAVYRTTFDFVGHVVTHAERPTRELERSFLDARSQASFLFFDPVRQELKQIWDDVNAYTALKLVSAHLLKTEGHHGSSESIERTYELLTSLSARLDKLDVVFGKEMALGVSVQQNASC